MENDVREQLNDRRSRLLTELVFRQGGESPYETAPRQGYISSYEARDMFWERGFGPSCYEVTELAKSGEMAWFRYPEHNKGRIWIKRSSVLKYIIRYRLANGILPTCDVRPIYHEIQYNKPCDFSQ